MIHAIVPAKALDQAKGRLAAILTEDERRALALAMLQDVVAALQAVSAIDLVAVVSPDADARRVAADVGATAIEEPASVRGINQALAHAAAQLPAGDAVIVVLADVPQITPSDVQSAIDALPERGIAIVPSHDKGTSLLAMRPAGLIPFRFGPKSATLHRREAAALGVPCEVLAIDSLARDIDTPDDLRELAAHPAETATHTLLAQLNVAAR